MRLGAQTVIHSRWAVYAGRLCAAALFFALVAGEPAGAAAKAGADPAAGLCRDAIAAAERAKRIPQQLLSAIALAESGRWDNGRRVSDPWPWTVTSGARSRYLPTRRAAIAEFRRLKAAGVRNIDVGCMQINLHYHADAFDSLEAAFDPATNVAYGAAFLKGLHDARRSWSVAVAHYHSTTQRLNVRYRKKVYHLWRLERRRAAAEHRHAVMAAHRAKRAAREGAN